MKLLQDIGLKHRGLPILVIGGGASVADSIREIPHNYPGCVISANEHGFRQRKFEVDYIVSVDYTFAGSAQPMRERLKPYGVPTINRWSWADYRLPEWTFNGDSGLTAILVAAMLGGAPVLAIGVDRWTGVKRYFWEEEAEQGWDRRKQPNSDNQKVSTAKLVEWTRGLPIRVLAGPLREHFKLWRPDELCVSSARPRVYETAQYQVNRRIFLHHSDPVDGGRITLTKLEAHQHLRSGAISPIVASSD